MASPLDPTQFTRESAERIANVVRAAELASPAARPLNFERMDVVQKAKVFRVCTFNGAWPTGVAKVVTFKYQTQTPNTASALNLFFPVSSPSVSGDCAIAKEGTSWFLVDVPFEEVTAVFVSRTASVNVFGTGSTSVIRFLGTGSTSVITLSGTAATSTITFITGVSASLDTANCNINISTQTATALIASGGAPQTATSISMSGTQTAISVSMAGTQTITVAGATFTSTFLRFRA
jgi:hypothetical protein